MFLGSVRAPDNVVAGIARVTFSLGEPNDANGIAAEPLTIEIPVVE